MIVFNTNPKGTPPIVIVTKWSADPLGGQAIPETTYMIAPGEGIDLAIVGLEPKAVTVFGGKMETGGGDTWRFHEDRRAYPWDVTHSAQLVGIEEIDE